MLNEKRKGCFLAAISLPYLLCQIQYAHTKTIPRYQCHQRRGGFCLRFPQHQLCTDSNVPHKGLGYPTETEYRSDAPFESRSLQLCLSISDKLYLLICAISESAMHSFFSRFFAPIPLIFCSYCGIIDVSHNSFPVYVRLVTYIIPY